MTDTNHTPVIELDIPLPNKWTIWYHKQDEPSWETSSYIRIYDFNTIRGYVMFVNSFHHLPQFLNGYYFFMRDGIIPIWEDVSNRNGGCYNIKVQKDIIDKVMWDFMNLVILKNLMNKETDVINGISIVSKKYNALIKVWNSDKKMADSTSFNKVLAYLSPDDVSYRSHTANLNFTKDE
jgi:hypothetical protein